MSTVETPTFVVSRVCDDCGDGLMRATVGDAGAPLEHLPIWECQSCGRQDGRLIEPITLRCAEVLLFSAQARHTAQGQAAAHARTERPTCPAPAGAVSAGASPLPLPFPLTPTE